jgi:hypothetical protein
MNPQDTWISVREAAQQLGCAERTVLLHLQKGILSGKKEGKAWLVSLASMRHKQPARTVLPLPQEPAAEASGAANSAEMPHFSATNTASTSAMPQKKRQHASFMDLSVLRILAELAVRTGTALSSLSNLPAPFIEGALRAALASAQCGAAGYHAFLAGDKLRLYAQAREQASMSAAALLILAESANGQAEGLRPLAAAFEDAAGGIGGLMRKVTQHAA